MSKFPWGKVIDRLFLDFDGDMLEIVKYHPSRLSAPEGTIEFHIEDLHSSFGSVQSAVIAYIAYKNLGLNQYALVEGICRALEIKE